MSDKVDYYYSRRKENYYNTPFHIMTEQKPKGYMYLNLLDKLIQLSLQGKGRLVQPDGHPYDPGTLSALTRHDVETIREGLEIFEANQLIEILPSGVIYILDIPDMIGRSSSMADKKRRYRAQIAAEREGRPYIEPNSEEEQDKCLPEKEPKTEITKNIYARKQLPTSNFALEYTDAFEQLWDRYPRKSGKREAFAAYLEATKEGVSDDIIADGIENYRDLIDRTEVDDDHITTGANWFRNRRWEDEG